MALKVITPGSNTGYDTVGTTDYRAGMIGARNATTGVVVPSDGTDGSLPPIGVLGEDKLTTGLQQTTQQNEQVTLTSGVAVALAHDAVVANSQFVEVASTGTDLTESTDYTFDDTNGTITSMGTQTDGTVVYVTYTYQLNDQYEKDFRGVNYKGATDDTEGSGKSTVWKGFGEYETDQFDTAVAYAVNDKLHVTNSSHGAGAGLISTSGTANTGNICVGRVTKVPTAADPWLGFAFEPSVQN